jgi:hypothetical protein
LFAGILRPQLGHKRGGSHGHSGLVIRAASTLPQTPGERSHPASNFSS